MKQASDHMNPGDFAHADGSKIAVEDGVLELRHLDQYSTEQLMAYRAEIYKHMVDRWNNMVGYVMALTILNTELAVRKQAPTSN